MKTLVVRQTMSNGASRTWRLRPDGEPVTLGTSRLARLTSVDPRSHGIDGAFSFTKGEWTWIPMNPARLDAPVLVLVEDSTVRLEGSELRFGFHAKDEDLYRKLEKVTAAEPASGTDAYELEIVKFGDRVLSTQVRAAGAKPTERGHGSDKVTVIRRPVHLAKNRELLKNDPSKSMDAEARRGTLIVAACSVLFTAAAVFGPRPSHEMASAPAPAPQEVKFTLAPAPPIKPAGAAKKAPAPSPTPASGDTSGAHGGKVAGFLKTAGGRFSQLLGKVSAQAARSREVVVQQTGVKAGEGPSGRALSALGKVDKSGGDWSAAAQGAGVTVSTNGRGGGKGSIGSNLSAGSTGQGGVGLVEDESEITGGLDREIIAQTIKSYLGQILYCYERQLSANPDLFGKVAVRFTIGGSGAVEAQAIGDTTLRNATVEGCILNKVAAWKFPAPNGGTKVMVTYPFLFKSTN